MDVGDNGLIFVNVFDAVRAAQNLLAVTGSPNAEYIRGQAELICDLFSLDPTWIDEITEEIKQVNGPWVRT